MKVKTRLVVITDKQVQLMLVCICSASKAITKKYIQLLRLEHVISSQSCHSWINLLTADDFSCRIAVHVQSSAV